MKFELEASDISAIANMVTCKLAPMFAELRKVAVQETAIRLDQTVKAKEHARVKSKVINTKELLALTGLSRSTIWRLEKEKLFPARRSLSGKRVGWIRSEVEAWIETRKRL